MVLLFWATVVAFVAPTSSGTLLSTATAPGIPHAVLLPHSVARSTAPPAALRTPNALLPGSDPHALASVNAPAIADAQFAAQASHPVNWTLFSQQLRAGRTAPSTSSAPAAPTPASGITIPTGYVQGYVYNNSGHALQGVSVQSYSASGASLCPQVTCPPVTTNASGGFDVKAPVGADYLALVLPWYLENITYVEVRNGVTTVLPTYIYMVQDAIAIGTVEANTSAHKGVDGVQVSSISRDQSQIGNPSGVTSSSGSFRIALPPLPSTITFSPPDVYLSTFVYANATPNEVVNLGIILLQPLPFVKVTLDDAVTRAAIPTNTCNAFAPIQCNSIKVCSSVTNVCLQQGPTLGSATVEAEAPLGVDYIDAQATGYIENQVPIGNVTGGVLTAPPIFMVPLGVIAIDAQITHNATTYKGGTGMYTISICGMDGYAAAVPVVNPATYTVNTTTTKCIGNCGYPFVTSQFGAFPLRNDVTIAPDTTGACIPPLPTWPIPGDVAVWGNETYLNATPDMVTTSYLNFTPGNYVYGTVAVSGSALPPAGGFTVLGSSMDNPTIPGYGYNSISSAWACAGYSKTPSSFCAAVPPGPGKLLVQSLTQSYAQNFTWGSTPYMCCYAKINPMTLAQYTGGFTSINLSALGAVHGRVFQGNTDLGVFFGSIKVSAAGNQPNLPSFDGAVFINGSFLAMAPLGWVSIQASASGFAPNTVWAYVTGNDSVGNISLTPLATVQGQIVDPTGHGIYEANVKYCHIDSPNACSVLGAGLSTTNGIFNGTLTGGWLPWTTYEFQVSAAGYTSDWTWANTTAGGQTTLAPVTLYPVGTNSTATIATGGSGGSKAAGVWIDGTLLDNLTGRGIQTGGIQACPVDGSACTLFPDGSNTDGYFNGSVTPGLYNLTVAPQGYFPIVHFFNATAASYLHLGAFLLSSLPWVTGRAVIDPFGNISVKRGSTWTQIELGPGSEAHASTANGSLSGTGLQVSSQGNFMVQTPGGIYNKVTIIPVGGTVGPSANGGLNQNQSVYNVTSWLTTLSQPVLLTVYGAIGGYVYDNSTRSPTGSVPWIPARWTPVAIATFGPNHAAGAYSTNGGGWYLFFVPTGINLTIGEAGQAPEATIPANVTSHENLSSAVTPKPLLLPQINLTHFGWVALHVVSTLNVSQPAAYVGISTTTIDPINGTLGSSGQTNAGGFANLTAPPGASVLVSIGPGAEFNSSNVTVSVNSSKTTLVNGSVITALGGLGLAPWGWVRSVALNHTFVPDVPTVLDAVNQLPLPLATVTVASTVPGLQGSSLPTNWNGEFLSDAPIGPADTVEVSHWAYLHNYSTVKITPGASVLRSTINVTGVGILAGQVLGYPGNIPIPFATVETCPYNQTGFSGCYTSTTNASGIYWIASYPGLVTITATANGYVSNATTNARAGSDTWSWVLPIVLNQFAYVFGTVRGLPAGGPIGSATVAACSPLGNPVGACGFEVITPPGASTNGHFLLAAPAGQYVLMANATGYNATYLPISLVPGEVLPVGILFLKQFGTVIGAVASATTLVPVANASVFACAAWSGGGCTPPTATDAQGRFAVTGPPGPYTLTVLAGGYADSYSQTTLLSGFTLAISPILLTPLGTDAAYVVSGRVVNASSPTVGIPNAVIAMLVNNSPSVTAQTDLAGSFAMSVLYGSYLLSVSAPGYATWTEPITIHSARTGLIVPLALGTFPVSGVVTDGLTHHVLPSVAITEGGIVAALSDDNGGYTLALANGTHNLTATYEGGGTVAYAPLAFTVSVNGAPVSHDIALLPPSVAIHGVVVDALSGIPLAGAPVAVVGTTADGVPVRQSVTSDPSGGFTVTLPVGSYNASATYTGYASETVAFAVTTAGQSVPLLLTPTTPGAANAPAPSGMSGFLWIGGALGILAVAIVALALLRTKRRPPAARPKARTAGAR